MKKIMTVKPKRGRPPKPEGQKALRHVGIALAGALGALMDASVKDEMKKNPFAVVNASSYLKGLVLADAEKRGLRVAEEKDGSFTVYKAKSRYEHMRENMRNIGGREDEEP
jgi:hypothetical protein